MKEIVNNGVISDTAHDFHLFASWESITEDLYNATNSSCSEILQIKRTGICLWPDDSFINMHTSLFE